MTIRIHLPRCVALPYDAGMPKYPDISVKLIMRVGDAVCLYERDNGRHDFPGGRIEWGESPETALKRELKEELDYTLTAKPELRYVWNYVWEDNSRHSVFIYYGIVLKRRPNLTTTDEEKDAHVVWLTSSALLDLTHDPEFVGKAFA